MNAKPSIDASARLKIKSVLRDRIEADDVDDSWPDAWGGGVDLKMDPDELPVPQLVRWILVDFIGSPVTGHDEKIAWQARFRFDGRRCTVALQKFGLHLYVHPEDLTGNGPEVLHDLTTLLKAASRVAASRVFRPFAENQVRSGHVTVRNQYHRLRRMYEHFRKAAESAALPDDADVGEGLFAPVWNRHVLESEQRFFNGVAMVNAYFSWLEHTLVFVWPFVTYDPTTNDLEAFVGDRWGDKFKTVFDITSNAQAKRHYDDLRLVADEHRNTYTHGGFGKQRASFLVHMSDGAIPANLTDLRGGRVFEFFPIEEATLSAITAVLDRVDAWLQSGPASYGVLYAEFGLDLSFDAKTMAKHRQEMTTLHDFEEYLIGLGNTIDRMINMDW